MKTNHHKTLLSGLEAGIAVLACAYLVLHHDAGTVLMLAAMYLRLARIEITLDEPTK